MGGLFLWIFHLAQCYHPGPHEVEAREEDVRAGAEAGVMNGEDTGGAVSPGCRRPAESRERERNTSCPEDSRRGAALLTLD